jgi:hypothetical protein
MRDPLSNPWPGNPNAYQCPWGCNGTGTMPWFAHVQGGVCFNCHGQGWILGRGQQQPRRQRPQWRREGKRIVPA